MSLKLAERTKQKPEVEWLEALNHAILTSALDCIITMDAQGRVLEFNPASERVFGYTRAEVIGQELAELIIPPALRDRHRRGLAHYLATGEGPVLDRRIEIIALRADGSEILVELAITAFQVKGEAVFTAYLRDVTERIRTERRRAAQYAIASLLAGSWTLVEAGEEILQTIANSGNWIFAAIWVREKNQGLHCACTWQAADEKLSIFDQSTRAVRLKTAIGLPGRVVESEKPTWIRDVTQDQNFPRLEAAAQSGLRGAFAFPLFANGEVNGVIELFSSATVQPDDDLLQMVESLGNQIGLFIHRREMQNALQEEKENAEAANAAKDQFLAMLSHELRTPLTPVLVWAGGMIKQPGIPSDIVQGLEMVCRNVELEARLIDDMLDLTRLARGKLQLDLRPADAHELIRHAMEIVGGDISARRINILISLDATEHTVIVDAARLQQVLWNLLRNSYKFTPDNGTVSVHSSNPMPEKLRIEITDTGVGIDQKDLERIFNAFEQVGARHEGLGLGLAISKAVVEMHGGTISARSEGLGKGSTFVVDLPQT